MQDVYPTKVSTISEVKTERGADTNTCQSWDSSKSRQLNSTLAEPEEVGGETDGAVTSSALVNSPYQTSMDAERKALVVLEDVTDTVDITDRAEGRPSL